jgi:hypothetical protein
MGGKLALQYNGLDAQAGCAPRADATKSFYCYLASIGGPKGFQTRTWKLLGGESGLLKALAAGVRMGANFVELPQGFESVADTSALRDLDAQLESNPCCLEPARR